MTRLPWVWAPALVILGVLDQPRSRHNIPGRARLLIYPVALAMLLAGIGGLYQAADGDPGAPPARCPANSSTSAGTACT